MTSRDRHREAEGLEPTGEGPRGGADEATPPRRTAEPSAVPERGAPPAMPPAPLLGKGAPYALLAWGLALLAVTAGIAGETVLWPLVPLFGVAVPVLLVLLLRDGDRNGTTGARRAQEVAAPDGHAERRVLEALSEAGELTTAGVAVRAGLTVARASEVLDRLAAGGHLRVTAREEALGYSLREGDRRAVEAPNPTTVADGEETGSAGGEPGSEATVEPPEEPLSEREREVLALLVSGRTNREIAAELYVSPGTVKAHVASIYRKLGVHNRAEMAARAKALGLLG